MSTNIITESSTPTSIKDSYLFYPEPSFNAYLPDVEFCYFILYGSVCATLLLSHHKSALI